MKEEIDLIGKEGIFTAYNDGAWGETYAGKKCAVVGYDDHTRTGLFVKFEDNKKLLIQREEFELLVN